MLKHKPSGNIVATIMMILLFGIILFITDPAALIKIPQGISNFMEMFLKLATFLASLIFGIVSLKKMDTNNQPVVITVVILGVTITFVIDNRNFKTH